ncbi:MAG: pantetheine-phosphate adenylyltransferase [Chloroflexi bacterium RBG_13_56_8]|nr:MAG: pantetheine-phosphate adenylyltransferase [Chloroflexi bacterium RBG_13_56_8]
MKVAVYPGTFDPVHYGHIDIAKRASELFDQVVVGIYDRPNKNLLFSLDKRLDLMREALRDTPNIEVEGYDGLTVDFAKKNGAQVIVRGLRVVWDFELEYQMALTNRRLSSDIDTVCLMTTLEYAFISSSSVKEIAQAGGAVDQFVPPHVAQTLRDCFEALRQKSI